MVYVPKILASSGSAELRMTPKPQLSMRWVSDVLCRLGLICLTIGIV
jgi:hypothetical protein